MAGFGFCSSCGAPLAKAQQKFCSGCGATIETQVPIPAAEATPAAFQLVPPPAATPPAAAAPFVASVPEAPAEPAAVGPFGAPAPLPASAPDAGAHVPPPWAVAPMPPAEAAATPPPWAAAPVAAPAPVPASAPVTAPAPWTQAAQTPPPPWAASVPGAMPGAMPAAPTAPVAGTTGAKGMNPMVIVVGLVAVLAIGGVAYAMSNNNKAPIVPSGLTSLAPSGGSSAPSSTPTPAPTPTKAASKGTIKVTPASFACDDPGSATLDIALPASVDGGTSVTFKVDSTSLGTDTVTNSFTQQADGSWTTSQDQTISELCASYKTGKHVVKVVDDQGATLAQASFTITGSAPTPTPKPTQKAGGSSIVIVPGIFSCSSTGNVSMVVVVSASIPSTEKVTMTVDSTVLYSDTVGQGFVQQADGTWLSSGEIKISSFCNVGTGNHVLKLLDHNNKVLAQASFTAQP